LLREREKRNLLVLPVQRQERRPGLVAVVELQLELATDIAEQHGLVVAELELELELAIEEPGPGGPYAIAVRALARDQGQGQGQGPCRWAT
jgi:hypothetical protein